MIEQLFLFLVIAVADSVEGRRPGARHAMLVFVTAEDFEAAQGKAAGAVLGAGWMMVRLEKGKPLDANEPLGDEVMADAARSAIENGSAIVVHGDELPAEA